MSGDYVNRKALRAEAKKARTEMGRLKLRCIGCDRVGRPMTKEHTWPKWLAERAQVRSGINWYTGVKISPAAGTIPLCDECNHQFGAQLEEPVSRIFASMEAGLGLSDLEAEMLVRWLWKFEGLFWNALNFSHPTKRYSDR